MLYTRIVVGRRRTPMGDRARRHDEIRGATVLLTGWSPGREDDVAETLGRISGGTIDLDAAELPIVALGKTSLEKAEAARALLSRAGGIVELEDAWVTRDAPRAAPTRPACPFCGSTSTQPYTHAGPGARKRMKCTTCGRAFQPGRPR
jgi:hypothetical protein